MKPYIIIFFVFSVMDWSFQYAYHWRGYFTIGGEWLLPALMWGLWRLKHEIKELLHENCEV